MEQDERFLVVLDPVPAEALDTVAGALATAMTLPVNMAKRIVSSCPIALLTRLRRGRAERLRNVLASAFAGNASVRVAPDQPDSLTSRLEWPLPPSIAGLRIDEYPEDDLNLGKLACPSCGIGLDYLENGAGGHPELRVATTDNETIPIPVVGGGGDTTLLPSSDLDPLFSGLKPLDSTANLQAVKDLRAGKTGFWKIDWGDRLSPVTDQPPMSRENGHASTTRSGLAAYLPGGPFAVIINRSTDINVARLVAEVGGLPEDEAREKCLQPIFCVARDIAKAEAQTLLTRFEALHAKGRIVRPS